jgi:ABC-type branched-subunit amino acid transport system substrate-binding protein
VGLALLAFSLLLHPAQHGLAVDRESSGPTKVKLGVIVPLTGPLGFLGKDFVRAYGLVKEAHPAIDELIDITWEDSAYDSKQAISAFNNLVATKRADIILSFGGPMLQVLAPLAEQRKIPFFATESETGDCVGREFCSLFRNNADEWGHATWRVLRGKGSRRIGIVKNQNQFMNTFVDAIVRTKKEDEYVEVLLDIPPETIDLRTHVLTMRSNNIDALGLYLLPGSHNGFLAAAKGLNKQFPLIFGVEALLQIDNNKGFAKLIQNALVVAPAATDQYRHTFHQRYGHSAGFMYTPAFYDFLVLLKDIVNSNPAARGKELVHLMHFSGNRAGVSGTYSVKVAANGVYTYSFPISVYQVGENAVTVAETIHF